MTAERKNIAVIGLGLLGASLALALKETGSFFVSGWTRKKAVRDKLFAEKALDFTADSVEEVLGSADVSILCMPVPQIAEFLNSRFSAFKPGSLVSDVGSVKGSIMEVAASAARTAGFRFVGGHPMAGSEKSGPEAATKTLFNNAVVFLTPGENATEKDVAELSALWRAVGGLPSVVGALEHDRIIAKSSHLPHAVAWSLALTALDVQDAEAKKLAFKACASSFRDMTRVAESSPELWEGIFKSNKASLLAAIDEFQGRLNQLKAFVAEDDAEALKAMMGKGKSLREEWAAAKSSAQASK